VGYDQIDTEAATEFGIAVGNAPDWATDDVAAFSLRDRAEIVSLHVPLSDSSRGLIDADLIGGLRDGAMLINAARGDLRTTIEFMTTGWTKAVVNPEVRSRLRR
jgi:lactate dehydrogenase-like 2-hydroxyacid dehydrogenase